MTGLKNKLLDNLRHTYCRLKKSRHGVGVFAIVDIPKNTNPFLNCKKVRWFKFKKDEIASLPKEVAQMIKEFYGSDNGYHYIPNHGLNGNDISFFLNHSLSPNTASDPNDSKIFKTTRNIKQGEELFINYKEYDPEDEILSQ